MVAALMDSNRITSYRLHVRCSMEALRCGGVDAGSGEEAFAFDGVDGCSAGEVAFAMAAVVVGWQWRWPYRS